MITGSVITTEDYALYTSQRRLVFIGGPLLSATQGTHRLQSLRREYMYKCAREHTLMCVCVSILCMTWFDSCHRALVSSNFFIKAFTS